MTTESDLAERRAALAAVGGADHAAVAKALITAYVRLERDVELIREDREKILRRRGGSKRLGPLRHRLRPIRKLQASVTERLMGMRSPAAVGVMLAGVLGSRGSLPLSLRIALAGRSKDASSGDLEKLVASTGRVRGTEAMLLLLRAIEGLGSRGSAAGEWAVGLLDHSVASVRAQAAVTLSKMDWPGSLRSLIDRIDAERDSAREEIFDALVTLTGVHPGDSSASWRLWLEKEGTPYLDGTVRLGRGDAKIRVRKNDSGATSGTYFGVEQKGNAILYVIDISLSMRASSKGGGRPGGAGGGGPSGRPGGARGGNSPLPPGEESRWDLCKKELTKALRALKPDQTFNIVGFANHLVVFDEKMCKAKPRIVRQAIEWLGGLKLELETNIYDALELSFLLGGRGVEDRYYEPEIDTIFFLSDGAPTIPRDRTAKDNGGTAPRGGAGGGPGGRGGGGRMGRDEPDEILAAVRRWNALSRVSIFTIGLGMRPQRGPQGGRPGGRRGPGGMGRGQGRAGGPRVFLQKLADQNNGKFVEPK